MKNVEVLFKDKVGIELIPKVISFGNMVGKFGLSFEKILSVFRKVFAIRRMLSEVFEKDFIFADFTD